MPLADFQRAFSLALADAALAKRFDAASPALPGLSLTPVERERLRRILAHPGMAANRIQLRSNRSMPIQAALPLTCDWLRTEIAGVLDAWIAVSHDASVQYGREADRFARWLPAFLVAEGAARHPALTALRYERALDELVARVLSEQGDARVEVLFEYEPDRLLEGWSPGLPPLDPPTWFVLGIEGGAVVLRPRRGEAPSVQT